MRRTAPLPLTRRTAAMAAAVALLGAGLSVAAPA